MAVVPAHSQPLRSLFALGSLVSALMLAPHDAHAAAPTRGAYGGHAAGAKSTASAAAPHTPRTPRVEAKRAEAKRAEAKRAKVTAKGKPKGPPARPCFHDPAFVQRGAEGALFALTRCDGTPAPLAVERLSVLARPNAAAAAPVNLAALARQPTADLAPGVRRMDARLVERLQAIVDHFGRGSKAASAAATTSALSTAPRLGAAPRARIVLVSGYRPASVGSFHAHGRALDLRLEGVANEELVAFCKTLRDTGCGYYPNSSFVHLDVREAGAGHVEWIDGSGPGESPHYVSAWPPPPSSSIARSSKSATRTTNPLERLDPELAATAIDEHPSLPTNDVASTEDADEDARARSSETGTESDSLPIPAFAAPEMENDDAPPEAPSSPMPWLP